MPSRDYDPLLPRNPITHQRHRREVFWQISLPFVITCLIVLVLAVLATGLSAESASTWADISLIYMIIPALLFSLLAMVILAAGVYLSLRLLRILPFYFFRGHNWFLLVNLRVGRFSDSLVEPFLRVRAWKAGASTLGRQVRRRKSVRRGP
jgi:hypothetical protein